jgi:pimeloyl-ACP methyl ester carboxylesterase
MQSNGIKQPEMLKWLKQTHGIEKISSRTLQRRLCEWEAWKKNAKPSEIVKDRVRALYVDHKMSDEQIGERLKSEGFGRWRAGKVSALRRGELGLYKRMDGKRKTTGGVAKDTEADMEEMAPGSSVLAYSVNHTSLPIVNGNNYFDTDGAQHPPRIPTHPQVSFYTSGIRTPHHDSYIITNQSYVGHRPAFQPSYPRQVSPIPILFIHGGGLTGAMWESTPDCRPGWACDANHLGYHAYLLDTVDHGRSQRAPDQQRMGEVEHRTAKYVWERFRIGSAEDFEERKPFEGSQFPVEDFDVLIAGQAARRRNNDEIETRGVVQAIRKLGVCHIIAHSHGAALVMACLNEIKNHISHLVLVEPGETSNPGYLTGQVPTLVVWGDYIETASIWTKLQTQYKRRPTRPVDSLNLPGVAGIKGNSHFLMIEKNSSEIFDKIVDWMEDRVKRRKDGHRMW